MNNIKLKKYLKIIEKLKDAKKVNEIVLAIPNIKAL